MISLRFVLLATVLSSAALASTDPQRHYRQRREVAPTGFKAIDRAPEDEPITLHIALAQRDFSGLEKALYAASTPGSEKYGQYLTKDQVSTRSLLPRVVSLTHTPVNRSMLMLPRQTRLWTLCPTG